MFCRERSERFRNTPWEMPRVAMAGEFVGHLLQGNLISGVLDWLEEGDIILFGEDSCTLSSREREMYRGKKRTNGGISDQLNGESDRLTSWGIKRKEK